MSRPVWDSTQLPMEAASGPRPPNDGASNAFKTNVNRQKTRRWVEAKTYSYDGDDWGEVDDYDEYRATPSPAQSTAKPTGLRQRGQSASMSAPSPTPGGPSVEIAASPDPQPVMSVPPGVTGHGLAGGGTLYQETPSGPDGGHHPREPARRVDAYDAAPASSMRSSSIGMTPAQEPSPGHDPYADTHGRTPSATSFRARMHRGTPSLQLDVPGVGANPGIVAPSPPPPSQPRHSPTRMSSASHSPDRRSGGRPPVVPGAWHLADTPSRPGDGNAYSGSPYDAAAPMAEPSPMAVGATSFPPRKSSLTQAIPLPIEMSGAGPHPTSATVAPTGEASPAIRSARERSVSGSRQPATFIRPADIYKRMEEERSRERETSESTRRSMESVGSRPTEADLPATSTLGLRRSTESLRQSGEGETSFRVKTRLDPVTERKSEYGLEGLLASNAQRAEHDITRTAAGHGTAPTSLLLSDPRPDSSTTTTTADTTTPPSLPAFGRLSGFGDGLWTAPPSGEASQSTAEPTGAAATSGPSAADTTPDPSGTTLEHQPSMGFRSVVHQAFDRPSSPPATDSLQSTPAADPRRSNTTSTAGISPIISRAPSGSAGPIPAIAEEGPPHATPSDLSRPRSNSPGALTHPPAPSAAHANSSGAADSPPPTIRRGHRRDLSTPSPNNSPARSPGLEVHRPLPEPNEAELAMTSPVEPPRPDVHLTDSAQTWAGHPQAPPDPVRESGAPPRSARGSDDREPQAIMGGGEPPTTPTGRSSPPHPTDIHPAGDHASPPQRPKAGFSLLRSKVKDLAGRFENPIQPKPLRGDSSGSRPDEPPPSTRPGGPPRDASFRPALPGGWVSYGPSVGGGTPPPPPTTDPSSTPNARHPDVNADPDLLGRSGTNPATGVADHPTSVSSRPAEDAVQRRTPESEDDERAAAAPGRSAVTPSTLPNAPSEASRPPDASLQRRSRPSSVPPTPPPKDTPATESSPGSQSNYFTTPLAPRRPPIDRDSESITISPALDLPPVLPPLSTDNSPHDQESDKLRKEIVKSLNFPELSATSGHPAQWESYQPEASPPTLGVPDAGASTRDSTVLPREYDSYWASMRDEPEAPSTAGPDRQSGTEPVVMEKERPSSPMPSDEAAHLRTTDDAPADYFPRPLSTAIQERSVPDEPTPASHPSQSSTESPDRSTAAPSDPTVSPYVPTPDAVSHPAGEPHEPPRLGHMVAEDGRDNGSPNPTGQEMLSGHPQPPWEPPVATTHAPEVVTCTGEPSTEDDATRPLTMTEINAILEREGQSVGAPVGSSVPATSDAATLQGSPSHVTHQSRRSPDVPEHQAPPPDQSPPPTYMSSDIAATITNPAAPTHHAAGPPTPLPTTASPPRAPTASVSPAPPALSFHEIAALKTPAERIQAYHAARQHYASRDTGLRLWVATMRDGASLGHAATAPMPTARSSGDASARPLHPPLSPLDTSGAPASHPVTNSTPTVQQQPYYQQYLQFSDAHHASSSSGSARLAGASPSTAAPPGAAESTPSPNTTGGGKLSRDQVQAKGKDLLHTAGVLGGRANVAAKGFFSKGKSRWRTSGGGSGSGGGGGGGGGDRGEH